MKKPAKGWFSPNAWLTWKMRGWTLEEIKIAFLALIPSMPGSMITVLWYDAMCKDGYFDRLTVPDDAGEPDVDQS